MKNSYFDLIDQSYYFPQEGFDLRNGYLTFHGISLKYLIEKYKTPFKLLYLPRIGEQIRRAKNLFSKAMKKTRYKGKYNYCYCTKCCHFAHVLKTALKEDVHLETSSSFDIDLILRLLKEGEIDTSIKVVHNGHKTKDYLNKIIKLHQMGFENAIIVLDSTNELKNLAPYLEKDIRHPLKIGIRVAINQAPKSDYHTSRLGIPASNVLDFYLTEVKDNPKVQLQMMHFFVDSGIRDNLYYWGEFQKMLQLYAEIKKQSPSLEALNLGGGFPIRNSLQFNYNYEGMITSIVETIKDACDSEDIPHPHIYTEFGKYTVGESGAIIFQVLEQKQQNDEEKWYIIDNSLMNTIPDAWSIFEKFILLPVNKWKNEYEKVNIGGISCDHSDYYNSEDMNQEVVLPVYDEEDSEPLYIGFFHTGAYQDAISGYGGIKHCLIPSPKMIMIDRDETGRFVDAVYRNEQKVEEMLNILGYNI